MANNTNSGEKATPEKTKPVSLVLVLFCLFGTLCVAFNSLHKIRNDIFIHYEIIFLLIVLAILAIHIWNDKKRDIVYTVVFSILILLMISDRLLIPISVTQKDVIWAVRDQDGLIKTTSTDQPEINIPRSFRFTVFKIPRELVVIGMSSHRLHPPGKTIKETYRVSLTLEYSAKDIEHLLDLPEYRFDPSKLNRELSQKIKDQIIDALKNHTQREAITLNVIADAIQKLNTELGTTDIQIEKIELDSSYKNILPLMPTPTPRPEPA